MRISRTLIATIVVAVISLSLVFIYFKYDPGESSYFPKCPFKTLTGYPCAGCGSQRFIHALLHLDFKTAVKANFILVLFIPLVAVLGFSSLFRTKYKKLYQITHHSVVAYASFATIMLWWVLRIIFGW